MGMKDKLAEVFGIDNTILTNTLRQDWETIQSRNTPHTFTRNQEWKPLNHVDEYWYSKNQLKQQLVDEGFKNYLFNLESDVENDDDTNFAVHFMLEELFAEYVEEKFC